MSLKQVRGQYFLIGRGRTPTQVVLSRSNITRPTTISRKQEERIERAEREGRNSRGESNV